MSTLNVQPLNVVRGEDFSAAAGPYTDVSNPDITGFNLAVYIAHYAGGPQLFTLTIGSGLTVTNASLGLFTIALTRAQTLTMTATTYYWSLWQTDAVNPNNEPLATGTITMTQTTRTTS